MSLILLSFQSRYRLKKNGIQEITNNNGGVNQSRNLKAGVNKTDFINKLKTEPIMRKMKMTEIETLKTHLGGSFGRSLPGVK